ncbi:MAG: hypothetical protein FI707_00330 [SAR202 cluster bacterium]|jgi:hypothetical protein|nr:hypothetical protein [Chloroflexota bacterium]MDP6663502.1 hypothetical protein [SAR202 cluster bacterium]HAL48139.1 hypothetical protein [Dehalococcoidia bacterium]MDP6801360.1 hypothetical protein [SAR202 cluster bacterium]MQG59587.1 hypothetical protein [SAR202 cluster bacterium]|tara:strand:- start:69 stop:512 length:444 start_codon:yes stop_codon:yes gene_type:complete
METLRYSAKRHVEGQLVYVLHTRTDERWMHLEDVPSRALLAGEIHELALSINDDLKPTAGVRDVVYIGFFEITVAGIADVGDEVWAGDVHLGDLAGFDFVHMPNHLNVVLSTNQAATGAEMGFDVGTSIRFRTPEGSVLPNVGPRDA